MVMKSTHNCDQTNTKTFPGHSQHRNFGRNPTFGLKINATSSRSEIAVRYSPQLPPIASAGLTGSPVAIGTLELRGRAAASR